MNKVKRVVEFFCARRWTLFAVLLSWTLLALWFASNANFSQNIFDLLPVEDSSFTAHVRAAKFFGHSKSAYFNVSGEDAQSACDALIAKLSKQSDVSEISGRIESGEFKTALSEIISYIPATFTEDDAKFLENKIASESLSRRLEDFKRAMASMTGFGRRDVLVADPLGCLEIFYNKLKNSSNDFNFASLSSGRITSADGKNFLVVAEGNFDSSDSSKSENFSSKIESIIRSVEREFPTTKIAYAGGYRIAADNAAVARRDCSVCFLLTLILMAILCLMAFKTRWFSLIALAPSLFGTASAFAMLALFRDEIASISVAFASIAVGVSIDYAVHILYRLDSLGKIDVRKASDVAAKLSLPIAATSGTTIIAFAIIYFCGSEGFSQLGFFGVIGVFLSAIASVFFMPPFTIGFGRDDSPKSSAFDFLAKKISPLLNNKRLSVVAVFVISILVIPFIFKLKIDGDISNLSAMTAQARADNALIRSIWKGAVSKNFVLVRGADSDSARLEASRLERAIQDFGAKVYPVSSLLPTSNIRAENIKRWNDFWSDKRFAELKENFAIASKSAGFNAKMFDKSLDKFVKVNPPKEDFSNARVLSKIFKTKFASDSQGAVVAIPVDLPDSVDKFAFEKFLQNISANANYIDTTFLGERVASSAFDWLLNFALLAFALAFAYLYIVFRRGLLVLSVLLPVAIGLMWSFGLMGALGVSINIVNAVFVIFAVCLAQDYAVFLIFSSKEKGRYSTALASILLSAFTTIFAFGALAVADHPMLKSLGLSAGISIFSILCACVLFSAISSKWNGVGNGER